MCTFVSLIARSRDIELLNAILAAEDGRGSFRRAEAVHTPCLRPLLAPDEQEYWLGGGGCDCGTYLGSGLSRGASVEERLAVAAGKYRRKGWSDSKIARALADEKDALSRSPRPGPNEEAAYWIDLLSKIAVGLSVRRLGLMHHFYRNAPGLEDFPAGRVQGGCIDAATSVLARMSDGIIHDFDCTPRSSSGVR